MRTTLKRLWNANEGAERALTDLFCDGLGSLIGPMHRLNNRVVLIKRWKSAVTTEDAISRSG